MQPTKTENQLQRGLALYTGEVGGGEPVACLATPPYTRRGWGRIAWERLGQSIPNPKHMSSMTREKPEDIVR